MGAREVVETYKQVLADLDRLIEQDQLAEWLAWTSPDSEEQEDKCKRNAARNATRCITVARSILE